ncbi:MAG TPA: SPOR domain-containing protein [Vicinamibacterales bacterium]|nr:SPOR domain-containing protein [Vicinamibacterales bacterium]
MSDEGFHEIQLNGKQLVFLFMAATVVSVVIFLCGVMVGRGVQTSREGGQEQTLTTEVRPVDPAPAGESATSGTPPAEEPSPVVEDYYERLVEGGARGESLTSPERTQAAGTPRSQPRTEPPAPKRAETTQTASAESRPATKPEAPPADAPARAPVASGPSSGYAVQLAALRERAEADAIAKQLVAKGYQAYVVLPKPGAPPIYRVQVGRFESRGEADRVAARLKKEERFDPWVTR